MSFAQRGPRRPPSGRPAAQFVLPVGRLAYVTQPVSGPGAPIADEDGQNPRETFVDGAAVEILTCRRRTAGVRYRVRSPSAGTEGWLDAANLRSTLVAVTPRPAVAVAVATPLLSPARLTAPSPVRVANHFVNGDAPGRRFGQR